MTALLQTRTTVESSRGDDAAMDGEIEAVPLPDWDIVDTASLDSFPASDPRPGGLGDPGSDRRESHRRVKGLPTLTRR